MNRMRREKWERAVRWAGGGVAAGVVLALSAALFGLPTLGLLVGCACAGVGVWRGLETFTLLPPMLPEYREEHLQLRRMVESMKGDLKLLPDVADELADLIEVDAHVRARATTNIDRIRRIYDGSAREGRVGVLDRLKAGWKTASGGDPISELQFMIHTLRTVLDREIADLDADHGPKTDAALRMERDAIRSALVKQRDGLDRQCTILKQRDACIRKTRESLRAAEMQAANLADLEHEDLRRLAGEMVSHLHLQVDTLEEALAEVHGPAGSADSKRIPFQDR
jgi:hypothetical protein